MASRNFSLGALMDTHFARERRGCKADLRCGNAVSGSNDGIIKLWDIQASKRFKTMRNDRPYEGMNITQAKGLTTAQESMLKTLGAFEENVPNS
jgi:WD40 repeat protein